MEALIQKLTQLLQSDFPNSELEIEFSGEHRIGGLLVWTGFAGQEQIARQRRLWNVLRGKLTPDEQQEIAAILTLTPEELTAARQ